MYKLGLWQWPIIEWIYCKKISGKRDRVFSAVNNFQENTRDGGHDGFLNNA